MDIQFRSIILWEEFKCFFKKWNFLKLSDQSMVDDKAEAREIPGRQAEGPTANLTESKNDENLW